MKSSHLFSLPMPKIDADRVMEVLDRGGLLLAATSRLATDWKSRLAFASIDRIIETPAVECWQHWLSKLGREQADIPVPFNSLQEQQLWERIIADDLGDTQSAHGLARHAANAYRLMQEYLIDAAELASGGEEAEALCRWVKAMQRKLEEQGRVLAANVPALLLPVIGRLAGVEHIIIDGFNRLTPMQLKLLQALHEHGVGLASVDTGKNAATMTLTECPDADAEYHHIAGRISSCLDTDARARIAVVTSRQVSDIEPLCRALDVALLPKDAMASSVRAVNMPGAPLSDQPLVCQALALLGLAGRNGIRLTDLSPLLFSPGIRGYGEECMLRAGLDAQLREDNRYFVGFGSLLGRSDMQLMPQLAAVVRLLVEWDSSLRAAGDWVRSVHVLLQETGFLQATSPDRSSNEVRQLNAFRECLASLVAVDAIHDKMDWSSFLSLLVSECRQAAFTQPAQYPQVSLVPLEQIAGLHFDIVFAVGFDEEALPLPAQPVPLLPLSLQHRHALFCTTPELAFAESAFLWQQLRQSAGHLHISFAVRREERELNVSPLLSGIVAGSPETAGDVPTLLATESYDDAPFVPYDESETISGGSDIIRNQSACPFRAFATHRLAVAPLGETSPGIEPRGKGALVHHALQYIWEELKSQQALLVLDEEAAMILIRAAVDHAWSKVRMPVSDAIRYYESRRMLGLLQAWLAVERERPPFEVVCCEKPYALMLPCDGEVRVAMRLKADRIDLDGEGRKLLIDYKTGKKQSVVQWTGERMEQPQLPLYSMAEGLGSEDAVCFARVRSGECGFEGLSGNPMGIRGIEQCDGKRNRPDNWPELLEDWQRSINALAREFVQGRTEIAPRDSKACQYCGLEAVCRIDEIGIDETGDDEEVEE